MKHRPSWMIPFLIFTGFICGCEEKIQPGSTPPEGVSPVKAEIARVEPAAAVSRAHGVLPGTEAGWPRIMCVAATGWIRVVSVLKMGRPIMDACETGLVVSL